MRCWGRQFLIVFTIFLLTIPAFAQETQPQKDLTTQIETVASEQWNTAKDLLTIIGEFIIKYSFQVLGGIIVLVLGGLPAIIWNRYCKRPSSKEILILPS